MVGAEGKIHVAARRSFPAALLVVYTLAGWGWSDRCEGLSVPHWSEVTVAMVGPGSEVAADRVILATLIEKVPDPAARGAKSEADVVMSYLVQKDFDKAMALARKMIQANPKDPGGYNLLGGAYLGKEDLANARKSFAQALDLQPDNFSALINLAQLDTRQKDFSGARKHYQAILAKDPKNISAMIGLARLENVTGNDKGGLAWLQRAKTENPRAVTPLLALALHYLRTRNHAGALAELDSAQRLDPDNPAVLDLLGQTHLAAGDKAMAVSAYKKLASVSPSSPLAHYHLGMAQFAKGDTAGAAQSMKEALRLKPDYPAAVDALAKVELRAGHPAEALRLAQQFQKLAPTSAEGVALEGDVYMSQQRFPQAAGAYERAFGLHPTGALAIKLHAAMTKSGNPREADARLQQWLNAHPDDTEVRQVLAGEYFGASENRLAIEQYKILLEKDPKNLVALNNLAKLYQREKDPRALEMAEAAFKLDPDSAVTADTLGWMLVEQGNIARGLKILEMAALKDPRNAETRFHLAAAHAKAGDKTRARRALERLLASKQPFPQRDEAQALLKQL